MPDVMVGFHHPTDYLVCTNTDDYPLFFDRIASSALKVIACDGAINRELLRSIQPDLLIGDLDSYQPTSQPQVVAHLTDQNATDCEKALLYLHQQNLAEQNAEKTVTVCGLGGGRFDHGLYHLKLLWQFRRSFASLNWFGRYDHCFVLEQSCTISGAAGSRISFFSPWEPAVINLKGVTYPVSDYQLDMQHSCSHSNSFAAHQCELEIVSGSVLVCAAI